ncbi:MAG: PEP-utilizing enzyme [Planctomycetes bacterium]|nr:PEP-utilizing enzyme [Planctomycetota bacterium]
MTSFVLPPTAPTSPATVGWKLHRQVLLARAGLPVPPLVCVTAAAFRAWFEPVRAEVAARLARLDPADARGLAALRDDLVRRPAPRDVARAVLDAARGFGEDEPLAVRGSFAGEAGEDSADDPHAGASETVLGATRATLLEALVRVWSSVVSSPALAYLRARGGDLLAHDVAVGVQRLVRADRAFVLFTRDPRTGAREHVVAAALGLGEGIVQERVEVDHLHLDPATGRVLRERRATKTARVVLAGSGTALEAVPPALADAPALSAGDLARVAALGREVEARLGEGPQDVEGCFEGDRLFVVQARPLQVVAEERAVFDASNVCESFPGRTRALTYAFARAFYRDAFRDALARLGVAPDRLAALEPDLERMLGRVGARVFYRLDAFYALFAAHPLFGLYRPHWEAAIGLERPLDPDAADHGALATARAVANLAWRAARLEADMTALGATFEAARGEALAALRPGAPARALLDAARRFARRTLPAWGPTLVNDAVLILAHGALGALARREGLLADHPALLSDLLCGDDDLESARVVQGAVALGERAQDDPALAALLDRGVSLDDLERASPAFAAEVRAHLARYGARGPEDLKLEVPALRDRPAALLAIVRRYAREGLRLADLRAREQATRSAAEALVARRLRAPARALFWPLLEVVRAGSRRRELSRYWRSELYDVSRRLYRALGERLAAEGALERPDDVWDLTTDEVQGAVDGTLTAPARGLVVLRRAESDARPEAMRVVALGAVAAGRFEADVEVAVGEGALTGLGSSAGVVRGRARVLTSAPEGPLPDDDGDRILVARETDPGWLYLMLSSRGLVVERGSLLSHTAIAGRKFGIPTVVGVRGATAAIKDGELIEVDGGLGVVRRLEDRAA